MRLRRSSFLLLVLSWVLAVAPPAAEAKATKPTPAVVTLRKETAKTVRSVGKGIQAAASVLSKQFKDLSKQITKGTIAPAAAVDTAKLHLVAYFDATLGKVHDGTDSLISLHESLCSSAGADDPVCGEMELSACGAGVTLHLGNQANLAEIKTGAQQAWLPLGKAADCVGEPVHFDCTGPSASTPPHVVAAAKRGDVNAEFAELSEFLANITTCTGILTIVLPEGYRSSSGNIYVRDKDNKVVRTIPVYTTATTTTIEVGALPPGTYRYNDYEGSGNGGYATVPEWEKAPPPPACPAAPELTFILDGQTVTTPAVTGLEIGVDDATGRVETIFFTTSTGYARLSWTVSDRTPGSDDVILSPTTPAEVTLSQGSTLVVYRPTAASAATSTSTGTFKIRGLANVRNDPSGCLTIEWTGGLLTGFPATFTLVVPVKNVVVPTK